MIDSLGTASAVMRLRLLYLLIGLMTAAFTFELSAEDSMTMEGEAQDLELYQRVTSIFNDRCAECHGSKKRKGDYRLDVKKIAFAGGESDIKAIVPKDPDDSELFVRISLARDDEDAMPPRKKKKDKGEDKGPLTSTQIDLIKTWIAKGAYWPEKSVRNVTPPPAMIIDADIDEKLDALIKLGCLANFNQWADGTVRVDIAYVENPDWDAIFEILDTLKDKLVWLDASRQNYPESFYEKLPSYTQLTRLHLEKSNVTDAHLAQIAKLKKLKYLNLYSTKITDNVSKLANIPNLESLYIYQTEITTNGIRSLTKANPKLKVIGL